MIFRTSARNSENQIQELDFQHFLPQALKLRKSASGDRFSKISATGARNSENELQELDFQYFRPQALEIV